MVCLASFVLPIGRSPSGSVGFGDRGFKDNVTIVHHKKTRSKLVLIQNKSPKTPDGKNSQNNKEAEIVLLVPAGLLQSVWRALLAEPRHTTEPVCTIHKTANALFKAGPTQMLYKSVQPSAFPGTV